MVHFTVLCMMYPLIQLEGLGERCKLPQWVPAAAKRYLVHFGLKNASGDSNFKCTFTSRVTKNMYVFSLFTSNITWGGTNRLTYYAM